MNSFSSLLVIGLTEAIRAMPEPMRDEIMSCGDRGDARDAVRTYVQHQMGVQMPLRTLEAVLRLVCQYWAITAPDYSATNARLIDMAAGELWVGFDTLKDSLGTRVPG
jgi:hypothetical protein